MPVSPPRPVVAALALAALAAAGLPAASAAAVKAPVRPQLSAAPDQAAPDDETPKIVFTLRGATRGKGYRIETRQLSGQNPLNPQGYPTVCTSFLGRGEPERAKGRTHVFTPSPIGSYELRSSQPCTGTYDGVLLNDRGSRPDVVVLRFRIGVPSLAITRVTYPGGR